MLILVEPIVIGPFFTGDTAPSVEGFLTYDTGGYVDLTGASVDFSVQRWGQVKQQPYGPAVTGGDCMFGVPANGEVIYDWGTAPLPVTPGWYCGRFIVTFADGKIQNSEYVIFEVRAGAPEPDVVSDTPSTP